MPEKKKKDEFTKLYKYLDKQFLAVGQQFNAVDGQFKVANQKLDGIQKQLIEADNRTGRIEKKLDASVERLDDHGRRIENLEEQTA